MRTFILIPTFPLGINLVLIPFFLFLLVILILYKNTSKKEFDLKPREKSPITQVQYKFIRFQVVFNIEYGKMYIYTNNKSYRSNMRLIIDLEYKYYFVQIQLTRK